MPPCRHSSRIDTLDLKAQIISKIGDEKAAKYFHFLNRLLSLKLSKAEFNKLCIATIGRENISLHNRFIGSIIKNASVAKSPPSKGSKFEGDLHVKVTNGYHRNNLQLLCGDAFPSSPRKGRSSNLRDRRFKDRPSPLGPNGKVQSIVCGEYVPEAIENQPRLEVVSVEDGEEVEQVRGSPGVQSRNSVSAPLGIQMNAGGARKTLRSTLLSDFHHESMCNRFELPDTLSLKKQLEQKLESEGLGISMDCANVLNNGLETFLKRMIKPCLELARSRSGSLNQLKDHSINGLWTERSMQRSACFSASLLDFRVAMELKPQLLGENWPLQFERVCLRALEK